MTTPDLWLLAASALLIAAAALLASADAALSRVSRLSVENLVRAKARHSVRLREVVADPARYVNVALFLRIACETAAVVLVAVTVLDLVDSRWQAIAITTITMLIVSYVVVGVAPRTLGRQHATRISLLSAQPLYVLAKILGPLTKLLILVGNAVTPGRGFRDGPFTSEAELRDLVDLAEERSLIADNERQMIHSVFELGQTLAREVMVPRTDIVFIERGKTLRQALSLALRSGFSRIPVIGENEDDVIGIVYLKDVARRVYDHREGESTERVESLMRKAYYVPDSKPVDELLRTLQATRTHIAVVLDEYGGVAGLVTIEDVLEEIVGEIADEYDTAELPPFEETPSGDLRVNARLPIDELADLLGISFDAEELDDVETVGGFIAKRLGKVPIPGARAEEGDFVLTAESTAGRRNRIGTVLVHRHDGAPIRVPRSTADDGAQADDHVVVLVDEPVTGD